MFIASLVRAVGVLDLTGLLLVEADASRFHALTLTAVRNIGFQQLQYVYGEQLRAHMEALYNTLGFKAPLQRRNRIQPGSDLVFQAVQNS